MRTLLGLGAAALLGIGLYMASPFVRERVGQVVSTFRTDAPAVDAANSTDDRRLVWRAARGLIAEHPLIGVGTGDVKDELVRAYGERGFVEPFRKKLNAHDQYLNTAVALGVGAALLLILAIVLPLRQALRWRDGILAVFLLLNGLNWTVESMLEVQAGVVFLAFFGWLFAALRAEPR
jgi:O-antigen ligase